MPSSAHSPSKSKKNLSTEPDRKTYFGLNARCDHARRSARVCWLLLQWPPERGDWSAPKQARLHQDRSRCNAEGEHHAQAADGGTQNARAVRPRVAKYSAFLVYAGASRQLRAHVCFRARCTCVLLAAQECRVQLGLPSRGSMARRGRAMQAWHRHPVKQGGLLVSVQ